MIGLTIRICFDRALRKTFKHIKSVVLLKIIFISQYILQNQILLRKKINFDIVPGPNQEVNTFIANIKIS